MLKRIYKYKRQSEPIEIQDNSILIQQGERLLKQEASKFLQLILQGQLLIQPLKRNIQLNLSVDQKQIFKVQMQYDILSKEMQKKGYSLILNTNLQISNTYTIPLVREDRAKYYFANKIKKLGSQGWLTGKAFKG